MSPALIIPAPIGQLGNRLTHFAHIRAFAMQRGLPLLHTAFHPYADSFIATQNTLFSVYDPTGAFYESSAAHNLVELFQLYLTQAVDKFPQIEVRSIIQQVERISFRKLDQMISAEMRELVFTFGFVLRSWVEANNFSRLKAAYLIAGDKSQDLDLDQALISELSLGNNAMILLDGWGYRCASGFALHKAEIMKALSPRLDLTDKAAELVTRARNRVRDSRAKLIGIHIRRGDYAEWQDGRYFFSWEQYASVVQQVTARFGPENVALLVCSNEMPPPDFLHGLPFQIGTDDPVVDMWALSACDYIVGPTSTFTGWATQVAGARFVAINEGGVVKFGD